MGDESMHRTLAAQAAAIWPQEIELIRGYGLSGALLILDLGCGPGEISTRLLEEFPESHLVGVDIDPGHVAAAKERCQRFEERAEFREEDAFATGLADGAFDLTLCRHMLQAVPNPEQVISELCRVTRPGGRLHLLAEDYGMIHFYPTRFDCDTFWRKGPMVFADKTGTDLTSGRKMFTLLKELGLEDVRIDYVHVDTHRVPRQTFVEIWSAWRDGYAEVIAEHSEYSLGEVMAFWEDMISCLQNPHGYALWTIPVISGLLPD
jgi:SAM-dependent methyltransferase